MERKAHEKSRAERVGFVCLHNHPFSGLLILPEKASTDGLGCATFIAFLQLLSSLKIISSIFNLPPPPYKVQPQNTKKGSTNQNEIKIQHDFILAAQLIIFSLANLQSTESKFVPRQLIK